MAEVLVDGEFWLPPQFLTDDDFFVDGVKATNNTKNHKDGESLFPYEFPGGVGSFGFSSDLSSPVESVLGSAETESDEEDYLAGLTRQMAHSTLEDDLRRIGASENPKGRILSCSPQSTLCALPSGCGCKEGSSRGSPNCPSRVSSQPATWDLLFAAAGEVERLRLNEETYGGFSNRGLLGPPFRKPTPNLDASGFYPQQSLSHHKLRPTHIQHPQQQLLMKQQNALVWGDLQQQQKNVVQNRGRYDNGALGLSPSAWPPLQKQQQPPNGSGLRSVFLGNPNGKRQCAGTGVFLPRRIGKSSEPRKKPACPTVLVPTRVAQALNLNLDEIGAQPQLHHPRFISSFSSDSTVLRLRDCGNVVGNQRQRNLRPQQEMSHEVRLPQEWSY